MKLYKADIDSAYRRVPIRPDQRHLAAVVFKDTDGNIMVSEHATLPFGSVGSVYGWDRVGFMLRSFARRLLKLPIMRYVDDYFGADHNACAEQALDAFARLVRACLGDTAIKKSKLGVGMPLTILGVTIDVTPFGVRMTPDEAKCQAWSIEIADCLRKGQLCPGQASKLAGKLAWVNGACFSKLGRTFLYPIFAQQRSKSSSITAGSALQTSLVWWLKALAEKVCEQRLWNMERKELLHMFVDARSTPPRVAAVLFKNGKALAYSDVHPPAQVRVSIAPPCGAHCLCNRSCVLQLMESFTPRGDGQIMSLELAAIAFGIRSLPLWASLE